MTKTKDYEGPKLRSPYKREITTARIADWRRGECKQSVRNTIIVIY